MTHPEQVAPFTGKPVEYKEYLLQMFPEQRKVIIGVWQLMVVGPAAEALLTQSEGKEALCLPGWSAYYFAGRSTFYGGQRISLNMIGRGAVAQVLASESLQGIEEVEAIRQLLGLDRQVRAEDWPYDPAAVTKQVGDLEKRLSASMNLPPELFAQMQVAIMHQMGVVS